MPSGSTECRHSRHVDTDKRGDIAIRTQGSNCRGDMRFRRPGQIVVADTTDPDDPLRRQNPLGKIPALILEDGSVLYDSRVILEFLDIEAGGGIVMPTGKDRIPVLTMQA